MIHKGLKESDRQSLRSKGINVPNKKFPHSHTKAVASFVLESEIQNLVISPHGGPNN